jgi:hypothetical protein
MNVKHTSYHIRFSTAKPRFHMVGDGDIAAKGRALGQETVFSGLLAAPEPSVELFAKNSARPVKPRFDSLGRASLDLRDLGDPGAHQGAVCFIFRVDFFDFSRLLLVERKLRSQPTQGRGAILRQKEDYNCSRQAGGDYSRLDSQSFFHFKGT